MLARRGLAERFLAQGQVAQIVGFAWIPLDISDVPTRHHYGRTLWQQLGVIPAPEQAAG